MQGSECDKCGEHALECDDHLVAEIVAKCLKIMRSYPTLTKMTACYNLTERVLRLFSIHGSKGDVLKLLEHFHEGIKSQIEEYNIIFNDVTSGTEPKLKE